MSDKIVYDVTSVENAMRCFMDMQKLEDTANFGKLTYKSPDGVQNNRYIIEEYKDRIDSTFYTDMATSTLAYTIFFLKNNFGEDFDNDVFNYCNKYGMKGTHDLVNDSEDEFDDFNGDESIFENLDGVLDLCKLYAYYNEYQLVTGDEEKIIDKYTHLDGDKPKIVLKKTDNINGVDMDFYYVGENFYDFSTKLLQHDYNVNFLEERIPGDVLKATTSKTGVNDIITMTETMYDVSDSPQGAGGYAWSSGYIVIRDDYFTDAICHELGHQFDLVNTINIGLGDISLDYVNIGNLNLGTWDKLAEEYAGDIYSIRIGSDISAGYSEEKMKELHNEFYAEAFQLYFYSPETRAALPKEVRDAIEQELEMYT